MLEDFKRLQAENAQLKAHNRQLVEALESLLNFLFTEESPDGFDDPHKGFVECDAGWQDGVEWGWNKIHCKLKSILEATPPAKLAMAEAEVLRAAEEWRNSDKVGIESVETLLEAVEAMQEAQKDG